MSSKSPPKLSEAGRTSELETSGGGGGTQPSGATTSSIVPHFGQPKIWPTADALVTFNLAAHDLQMIENGSIFFLENVTVPLPEFLCSF